MTPISESQRRYRNSDKGRATRAAYLEANRERRSAYNAEWYQRNSEACRASFKARYEADREGFSERQINRRFGVNRAEMIDQQDGVCLICARKFDQDIRPAVDHDHSCCSGSSSCGSCVRGILCGGCNVGLGAFGDDPERLLSAVTYLANSKALGGVGNYA